MLFVRGLERYRNCKCSRAKKKVSKEDKLFKTPYVGKECDYNLCNAIDVKNKLLYASSA